MKGHLTATVDPKNDSPVIFTLTNSKKWTSKLLPYNYNNLNSLISLKVVPWATLSVMCWHQIHHKNCQVIISNTLFKTETSYQISHMIIAYFGVLRIHYRKKICWCLVWQNLHSHRTLFTSMWVIKTCVIW